MSNVSYKISAEEYSPRLASALALYSNERSSSGLLQVLNHQFLQSNENYEVSLLLMQMMKHKSADLKAELGRYFRYGMGVSKDDAMSKQLYAEAKDDDSKAALVNLAWSYYEDGEFIKVIELLEEFIQAKDEIENESLVVDAYSLLGDSYSRTEIPDIDKSIKTLTYCGERYHDGFSFYRLSVLYRRNDEKLRDIKKAVHCLQKASEYGYEKARLLLADAYTYGDSELGIEVSYDLAKQTMKPLMKHTKFDIIRRLITVHWFSAKYGAASSEDYNTVLELYDRLLEFYNEGDSTYATVWCELYNMVGCACYAVAQFDKAIIFLKKAYEAGSIRYSDLYAYLLKEDGAEPDKYLPLMKEHYDQFKCFSFFSIMIAFFEASYEAKRYNDCLNVALDYYEKENDIFFFSYISRIVLYGLAKNEKRITISEVVTDTIDCYEFLNNKQEQDDSTRENKILFASALGYFYKQEGILWKAVNWYMKANSCNDACAAFELGRIYERSVGTFKADPSLAYEWYVRAANLGSEAAKREVACFKKTILRGWIRYR